MGRIFAIGESVLDIIFKNGVPVEARPGGSMFNTAISLGRLGAEVYFIGDYGIDKVGDIVHSFLKENGVSSLYAERFSGHNTALALAFLDESANAQYEFYKDFPENRLENINIEFEAEDILLFGSFFALTDSVRPALIKLLSRATDAGASVIYDPNFRKPHLAELERLKPIIIENINFADLVRGSDEDFELIFGAANADGAYDFVTEAGCGNLVYTSSKNGVDILSQTAHLHLDITRIEPLSTIGAGDSFNAGLIWSLLQMEIAGKDMERIPERIWEKAGKSAIAFATNVCMSYDNYISREFAAEFPERKSI
jgi:fructokinase